VMDFTLGERQQAVADLAAEVSALTAPGPRIPGRSSPGPACSTCPRPTASAVLEVAVLLTEIGRRAPSMQALATLMTGALPLLRWGRQDLLPAVASGEAPLTAALRETPPGSSHISN